MVGDGFADVADRLRRSTVHLRASDRGSSGSGVIWAADGLLVTNAHVARSKELEAELWDGRICHGAVEARDLSKDLAAVRLLASGLPAAAPSSTRPRPGELVIAVGNPLGFTGALTRGVVHAVGPLPGLGPRSWVQADVRLAPGNSGGPLANAKGEVVGINTMVVHGLGLAVPSDVVARFLRRRRAGPRLGITVRPVAVKVRESGTLGLMVLEIEANSPAAAASFLPGDILTGVDGREFRSIEDLEAALEIRPGMLRVSFLRGDPRRLREVTVDLSQWTRVAA